jgi:uncharacterized protein
MKVFITGGTGFVGSYATERLASLGHQITVITRSAQKGRDLPAGVTFVEGDPKKPGPWQNVVAEHDVIINLAGTSIFTLWTEKAKRSIIDSRVLTTRNLADAMAQANKEIFLLNASAVGYYGSWEDDRIFDESSPSGDDFAAEVCIEWEREAKRAEGFGARVALCRFGIVMGKGGGALSKMAPAFKYCVGSPLGSGKQWFSWVHLKDLVSAMLFVIDNKAISGPVNFTAPQPVTNEELSKTLARVLNRPILLPKVPGFLMKTLLGEFGSVLLKGQRVIPKVLQQAGFQFRYPTLEATFRDLLG